MMRRRRFFGMVGALLAAPRASAEAQDRREHCEALDREEHDLRARLDHERDLDRDERDRIDRRLHEIAEERRRDCG